MTTAADLLRQRAGSDAPALRLAGQAWTYRQLVAEASRRAALLAELRDAGQPPHIGVPGQQPPRSERC